MRTNPSTPKTIDDYIANFPPEVQSILEQVRLTIRQAAPGAEETISYKIPAFKLNGKYLIYFAGYKNYISIYPAPTGVAKFAKAAARYGTGKGTFRFLLDEPIPYSLISRVVKFRAKENRDMAASQAKKKGTLQRRV